MSSISSISVVIPCIPKHIRYLDDLLRSISEQSVLPYEVIISLSSYNDDDSKNLQERLCNNFQKLIINVLNKKEEAYSGENRNRGIAGCTTKYVTFIDADDLMVPHKLENLLDMFDKYDMDAILHTHGRYDTNKIFDNEVMKEVKQKSSHIHLDAKHLKLKNKIVHGHITVKKSVFDVVKQDPSMRRGQDSHFVRRVIDNGFKIYLIDKNLSIYREHLSSNK